MGDAVKPVSQERDLQSLAGDKTGQTLFTGGEQREVSALTDGQHHSDRIIECDCGCEDLQPGQVYSFEKRDPADDVIWIDEITQIPRTAPPDVSQIKWDELRTAPDPVFHPLNMDVVEVRWLGFVSWLYGEYDTPNVLRLMLMAFLFVPGVGASTGVDEAQARMYDAAQNLMFSGIVLVLTWVLCTLLVCVFAMYQWVKLSKVFVTEYKKAQQWTLGIGLASIFAPIGFKVFSKWYWKKDDVYMSPQGARQTGNKAGMFVTGLLSLALFILAPVMGAKKVVELIKPILDILKQVPYATWMVEWLQKWANGEVDFDDLPQNHKECDQDMEDDSDFTEAARELKRQRNKFAGQPEEKEVRYMQKDAEVLNEEATLKPKSPLDVYNVNYFVEIMPEPDIIYVSFLRKGKALFRTKAKHSDIIPFLATLVEINGDGRIYYDASVYENFREIRIFLTEYSIYSKCVDEPTINASSTDESSDEKDGIDEYIDIGPQNAERQPPMQKVIFTAMWNYYNAFKSLIGDLAVRVHGHNDQTAENLKSDIKQCAERQDAEVPELDEANEKWWDNFWESGPTYESVADRYHTAKNWGTEEAKRYWKDYKKPIVVVSMCLLAAAGAFAIARSRQSDDAYEATGQAKGKTKANRRGAGKFVKRGGKHFHNPSGGAEQEVVLQEFEEPDLDDDFYSQFEEFGADEGDFYYGRRHNLEAQSNSGTKKPAVPEMRDDTKIKNIIYASKKRTYRCRRVDMEKFLTEAKAKLNSEVEKLRKQSWSPSEKAVGVYRIYNTQERYVCSGTLVSGKMIVVNHVINESMEGFFTARNHTNSLKLDLSQFRLLNDELGYFPCNTAKSPFQKKHLKELKIAQIVTIYGFGSGTGSTPDAIVGFASPMGWCNAKTRPGDCTAPVLDEDGCIVGFWTHGNGLTFGRFEPITAEIIERFFDNNEDVFLTGLDFQSRPLSHKT